MTRLPILYFPLNKWGRCSRWAAEKLHSQYQFCAERRFIERIRVNRRLFLWSFYTVSR